MSGPPGHLVSGVARHLVLTGDNETMDPQLMTATKNVSVGYNRLPKSILQAKRMCVCNVLGHRMASKCVYVQSL